MKQFSFLFLLVLFGLNSCSSEKSPPRPNIILIMTDDQGWFDAGFNGNTRIRTPHLDQLAARGIILDRFYSASAVCSPTRASVITGRNPLRMNIPNANSGHLPEEEITLAEILSGVGYQTAHYGKWHLGTLTKNTLDANRGGQDKFAAHYSIPSLHGYEKFFGTESKVPTYDPMLKPLEFDPGESLRFGWKAEATQEASRPYGTAYWVGPETRDTINLEGDDSRVIMDRVIPFIKGAAEEGDPFFTTIWFHTPHLPVVANTDFRSLYDRASLEEQIYFGTISAMDEQVGRLWSTLGKLGLQEETLIWFCSDNGPENGTPGSTGGFRERKRSLYEGGVRVPAFVVWKHMLNSHTRLDFPAVTSDYLPTILDILDLELADDRPIDGESVFGLLTESQEKRERGIGFIYLEKISWVNTSHKLISTDGGKSFELYDLIRDREEGVNIMDKEPSIAEAMKKELDVWMESVEASAAGFDYLID